jgi:alpha-L-fucosidase 2
VQHGVSDPIHGLEKAGAIDNMLLQTDGGVMRVFHVWPSAKDASLVKLRDKGGMLVSSARSGGQVTYVNITSLAGKAASRIPGQDARSGSPGPTDPRSPSP